MKETLLFAYESAQIPLITDFVRLSKSPITIVAFDFWVLRDAKEAGLVCVPMTDYFSVEEDDTELLRRAQTVARDWYRLPEMKFFEHKGIRLGQVFEPMVDFYLERFLYYLNACGKVMESSSNVGRVIVPHTTKRLGSNVGPLAPFEVTVVIDVVSTLAKAKNLSIEVIGDCPEFPRNHLYPKSKNRLVVRLYNTVVGLLAPKRKMHIFASETWSHMAPFMELMNDVELTLMERKEIMHIPWRQIWKHRICVAHPQDLYLKKACEESVAVTTSFKKPWADALVSVQSLPGFNMRGVNWWEGVAPAFSYLVNHYAQRVITDASVFELMFRKMKPDKILLRASIGGRQHHFFLITQVARALAIPTIELQHANEIIDKETVHSRLEADYLAGYGLMTREMMIQNHKYEPDRIRLIGSPRFDLYTRPSISPEVLRNQKLGYGFNSDKPIVFVAVPAEQADVYLTTFDSFRITQFFKEIRSIQKQAPGLQIVFKFRPGNLTDAYRSFIEDIFTDGDVFLFDKEPIHSLISLSDIAISGDSTVTLEAMMLRCPVVLYPLKKSDKAFKDKYGIVAPAPDSEDALAVTIRHLLDHKEDREKLILKEQDFMRENYSFDGHSKIRLVKLLREPVLTI